MATQDHLDSLTKDYLDCFCAFRVVDRAQPIGPDITDVQKNEWDRALRGIRKSTKERLVAYIVELFLDKAEPTARTFETDIFVLGTALRDCVNMAAAGRLLRQARLLSDTKTDLKWLVDAVSDEMATHEHLPPMKVEIVSINKVDSLQVVLACYDDEVVSVS